MLIEDVFKGLTASIMSEPSNQSKQKHDMCVDVYSKVQFIDMSHVLREVDASLLNTSSENNNFYIPRAVVSDIIIPFDVNFFCIAQGEYIFLREYAPNVYTGCLCSVIGDKFKEFQRAVRNNRDILKFLMYQSFHVHYDFVKGCYAVKVDVPRQVSALLLAYNMSQKDYIQFICYEVCKLLFNLGQLSPKRNDVYVVDAERATYYTRKLTNTTVKVNRPIYIYVDKKDGESKIKSVQSENPKRIIHKSLTWLVRGHWRRLSDMRKIGKNAHGEYCVAGFTWIAPYKKGDKDGVAERKTYVALREDL